MVSITELNRRPDRSRNERTTEASSEQAQKITAEANSVLIALWPLLIVVNISVGAYLFMRTKKKDVGPDEEVKDVSNSSGPATVVNAAGTETPVASLPIVEPPKPRQPIPEEQQRELFKWLLEEKRKIKPRDAEERKCIDEEKAILKQFIRSKSIPTL
ncbi:hypothetical protein Leryth_003132 [Lithospermum erythrorhizon]|nr:hypothetical protein Leryth_003132 [Lithospermum erythrorhizon]